MGSVSRGTLVRLVVGLVLVEVAATYFFMVIRREYVAAGLLAVAGAYLAATTAVLLMRSFGGLAWPSSYYPSQEREARPQRREAEFAFLTGRVDSYLSNQSRPDELHPVITGIVRDRLRTHHGIDLDDQAAATPVLGEELARYVYRPPARTLQGRSYHRLTRLLSRIEEL